MPTIALDAGHGKDTYPPDKGVPKMEEYEFNSATVRYAKEIAERCGFEVVLTQGLDHKSTPLEERTNIAYDNNVDALLSFHADAHTDSRARGFWVFHWHSHDQSKQLAETWLRIAESTLPIPSRGVQESEPGKWTNFHMVRVPARNEIPAILIEHGFMTNPDDLEYLLSEDYRKQCAEVAIRACCDFFDIEFIEEGSDVSEWKFEGINYFDERGMLNNADDWKEQVDDPMPVWAAFIMLMRIHQDMEG